MYMIPIYDHGRKFPISDYFIFFILHFQSVGDETYFPKNGLELPHIGGGAGGGQEVGGAGVKVGGGGGGGRVIQLRSQLVYMITLAVAVKTYKIILEKNFSILRL